MLPGFKKCITDVWNLNANNLKVESILKSFKKRYKRLKKRNLNLYRKIAYSALKTYKPFHKYCTGLILNQINTLSSFLNLCYYNSHNKFSAYTFSRFLILNFIYILILMKLFTRSLE